MVTWPQFEKLGHRAKTFKISFKIFSCHRLSWEWGQLKRDWLKIGTDEQKKQKKIKEQKKYVKYLKWYDAECTIDLIHSLFYIECSMK